jgi:hypothetical protein
LRERVAQLEAVRRRVRPSQAARLPLPRLAPRPLRCPGRRQGWWLAYPHQDQLRQVGRDHEDQAPGAALV